MPSCTLRSASLLQLTSTASHVRLGSHFRTFRKSLVAVNSAEPSGAKSIDRTPVLSAASSHNSNVSKSTNFTLRSWPPVATRSSHGWNSAHVTAPSCAGSSLSIFPAVRSHSFTAPSNPPLRTHFPSGENRHALTPRSWPLYV